MGYLKVGLVGLMLVFATSAFAATNPAEQEIIDRFTKRIEKKHVSKLAWMSGNYILNRINRNNDYNKFANYTSNHFSNTDVNWLGQANAFGLEFGMQLSNRITWNVAGEYWMKMGQNLSGDYSYTPPGGIQTSVTNLKTELKVFGVSGGLDYYLKGAPQADEPLNQMALKIGASAGFYSMSWDVWDTYQNLNLATSSPASTNTTFKGSAPGIHFGAGIEQPLKMAGMVAAFDFEYLYLNFKNVAWYNTIDQEVIATYNNTSDGRVDIGLSGFRGRVELRRYFSL